MSLYSKQEVHAMTVEFVGGMTLSLLNNHAFAVTALLEHVAFDRSLDESWGPYPKERLGGFLRGMLRDANLVTSILEALEWRAPTP